MMLVLSFVVWLVGIVLLVIGLVWWRVQVSDRPLRQAEIAYRRQAIMEAGNEVQVALESMRLSDVQAEDESPMPKVVAAAGGLIILLECLSRVYFGHFI